MRTNKAKYDVTLKIKNDMEYISIVRTCLDDLLTKIDCTIYQRSELDAVVEQAVKNAIVFAYPGKVGTITVEIKIFSDSIIIKVIDKGCGIKDVKKAMTHNYTTAKDAEGLGFSIMQSLCEKVIVKSEVHKGTTVIFEEKIYPARYVIS